MNDLIIKWFRCPPASAANGGKSIAFWRRLKIGGEVAGGAEAAVDPEARADAAVKK